MKARNAFTLIELLICIACLSVLSGITAKLWVNFSRLDRTVSRNYEDMMRSALVFQQLRSDAANAVAYSMEEGSLITLEQLSPDRTPFIIRYRIADSQIFRSTWQSGESPTEMRIAAIDGVTLTATTLDEKRVRIQWQKDGTGRPGEQAFLLRQQELCVGGWSR